MFFPLPLFLLSLTVLREAVLDMPLEVGRYLLRGRGGKGLPDLSLRVGGKGRGRKSFLSKAQDRAKVDLGMGTQSSIEWALRAANAQAGSPI